MSAPDGSYVSRGLRPGGPYTVLAEASGYHAVEVKDVHLAVESGASVNVAMRPSDIVYLEKFSVVADATDPLFDPAATDKGTYLSSRDIENTITGDRSINSLAASDPRIIYNRDPAAKSISVNGLNNRYNSIMVDGVSASDPFGLNANNTAAERNPIPVEAIEAVAISASPYDVRKGNAIGAFLNSITKSGGNEFHGSLYYAYRDADFVGERLDGRKYPVSAFKEQTFGASLGGPIIPKRLFFFASYEKVDEDRDAPRPGAWADAAVIAQIKAAAEHLGFNPGDVGAPGGNKYEDTNLFLKADWQINDDHRLSASYRGSDSTRPKFPGFSTGSGINNFSFSNSWYDQTLKNDSFSAQLVSRWTDRWNTEIAVSRSKYSSKPDIGVPQPYLQIQRISVPGSANTAYATIGTDYSYHVNALEVESTTAELYSTYALGAGHTLHAGLQYETSDVYNIYMQHAYGSYEFATLGEFLAIADPVTGVNNGTLDYYRYRYAAPIPGVNPAAEFTEGKLGVFVRDVWRLHPRFQVDMGLRLDTAIIGDDVPFNQSFYNTFGVRNDATYDGKTIVQPRVGFNWQPKINDGILRTIVRGGAGLFYGGMPRVWLSNSYANTGMNYVSYSAGTSITGDDPAPAVSGDLGNQSTPASLPPKQLVSFMSPAFRLPSMWKANLAIERELGLWGMKATFELEKSWVKDDVHFRNINLRQTATASDGRALYAGTYAGGTPGGGTAVRSTAFDNRIVEITNTGKGHSDTFIFMLERPRKKDGWSWTLSYAYTDRKEVTQGNASTPGSLWSNRTVFNANDEELHRGDLEIRHSIKARVTKEFNLLPAVGRTTVTLRYEGRSGLPFSIVGRNDINLDGYTQNDLLYIPHRDGDPLAVFASAADKEIFYRIVDRYGLREGSAVSANSCTYPWVNLVDLALSQEVKLPGWRHKLKVGVDILNLGNLLNDKWGVIHGSSQFFTKKQAAANVVYNKDTGQYTYSAANAELAAGKFAPELSNYIGEPAATRWSILFSVRYEF
ncbi:hypothetical protein AW736_14145 [Termitidicoccus mucosus]|uniref:Uncharacterized protein n=1 Tax=Termitidicoccus mucosus TaxID=1184151 RepID=A0A178IGV3_9BACT|nr:hypothetical protein AW736_14145 [Opitutaceae bacterium TSB47]